MTECFAAITAGERDEECHLARRYWQHRLEATPATKKTAGPTSVMRM